MVLSISSRGTIDDRLALPDRTLRPIHLDAHSIEEARAKI